MNSMDQMKGGKVMVQYGLYIYIYILFIPDSILLIADNILYFRILLQKSFNALSLIAYETNAGIRLGVGL